MKNVLLAFALVLLLLVGLAAGFVVVDPTGARKLAGMRTEPSTPRPARIERVSLQQDKPAASPAATPAKPKRPPRKEDTTQRDAAEIKVARKARYVGPSQNMPNVAPPLPELYPFDIIKRTYPDAQTMRVEFAIKNASGTQWKSAYIVVRSSRHEQAYQFSIEDWKIDEVVGMDYQFPRSEFESRLKDLRVIAVTGEARSSALAERLMQTRKKVAEESGATTASIRRDGDQIRTGGLMAVLGMANEPMTGLKIVTASSAAATAQALKIALPADKQVPEELSVRVRETSDERSAAAKKAREFHGSGLEVQRDLAAFVAELNATPWQKLRSGKGAEMAEGIRAKLKVFNKSGVELATMVSRSQDVDVKKLAPLVQDYSSKIVAQLQMVEEAIQGIDSSFAWQSPG